MKNNQERCFVILLAEHLSDNVIHVNIEKNIMRRKITIIAILLISFCSAVFAQIEQDIIRPSINADQFSLGAKAETALTKGQLSVNIPLLELKGRGYNLPISLSFYSGDVTSSTEASPIGLGWALMAGGVITKTVKGTIDNRLNSAHHYNDDFLHNHLYNTNGNALYSILEDIRMDPMPDEYSYSLPGHSGTIDVTVDGGTISRKLYPDESYRIDDCEHGLCITADDGTKFYFEVFEERTQSTVNTEFQSVSWFLTRIVTAKGGVFTFNYAKEEYIDLSTKQDERYYEKYRTNRITSIVSDYGSVSFLSVNRNDRGNIGNQSISHGYESQRINRIELRDENGNLVKGYELDNSGYFTHFFAPENYWWTDIRHKLSSVTQYDSTGNTLPPYEFEYDYKFMKSRLMESYQNTNTSGEYEPLDSWTSNLGWQAFANLDFSGHPTSVIKRPGTEEPYLDWGSWANTVNDYFCLTSIYYPTGAKDVFTYEPHRYSKVNNTSFSSQYYTHIQGRRLASKIRYGSEVWQQTDYIYILHDSDYNARGGSSGVLTNPSIHRATYYTPGSADHYSSYTASIITSGRAFNSFMGPPVFYTEVEEVEKDRSDNILGRTIHYYGQNIVNPPVNYIYVHPNAHSVRNSFVEIQNRIWGSLQSYSGDTYLFNGVNMTYLAYPVGEFSVDTYLGDLPLKEVFIGKDGRVRSVKRYNYRNCDNFTKFGYKIDKQELYDPQYSTLTSTIFRLSKTEYNTRRYQPRETNTTIYLYNGEECDSICESSSVSYNKGRIALSRSCRENDNENEHKVVLYYFPDDIITRDTNSSSAEIEAINGLIENNIIADPIKTIIQRNGHVIGGECKDYRIESDMPLLKSLYKIKNTNNSHMAAPTIDGNSINYHADLYKEGEILTYDENLNPEHIKINDMQSRIYVWGYDGRFPIAVIDNLDYESFNTDTTLKSLLHGLEQYRKIETEQDCINLRNANAAIRQMLPEGVHITTYTYDPYFGMTSETSDSNLGTIYTYDSFGRLCAKYDTFFKKTEEYNYNYRRQ